jgi:DNA-binding transcriptional LysR family regulator
MNTKHAKYVLTVLEEGSITNAAKKLFVSQPSLSQMIKLAENNLGAPIFNRNTDPITLTYAGQKYVEAAKKVLAIDSNLAREIAQINQENHGTICLGIPVQRAMQVMPYVFPRFHKLFPMVELKLSEFGSATVENMVLEGALDLACTTTYPKHEELHYILIEDEELVLLSGRNTSLAKRIPSGTEISITEAKEESFIISKSGHSVRTTQDRLFVMYDMKPPILLETSSIEVAKRTAIASDAVMICPINYIEMSPDIHPHCCVYPIKGIENRRGFYLCHRKDFYLTKYMKSFIEILTAMEKPVLH